jgi:hypothetical protein
MPPRSILRTQFAAQSDEISSGGQLSVISETSSLLEGSVASAASQAPLKESKTVVRDRKIVFWTPVMVWPTGFIKKHQKETLEYRSDECLHNGKYPYIPKKLRGGLIIDL